MSSVFDPANRPRRFDLAIDGDEIERRIHSLAAAVADAQDSARRLAEEGKPARLDVSDLSAYTTALGNIKTSLTTVLTNVNTIDTLIASA